MPSWGEVLNNMKPESVCYSPDFLRAQMTKQGTQVTMGIDHPNLLQQPDKYLCVLFVLDRDECQKTFEALNK